MGQRIYYGAAESGRAVALVAGAALLLACSMPALASAPGQEAAKAPPKAAAGKPALNRTLPLPYQYEFFARYAVQLDTQADRLDRTGGDGSNLRDGLRRRLRFSAEEYARVLSSSRAMVAALDEVDRERAQVAAENHELAARGMLSPGGHDRRLERFDVLVNRRLQVATAQMDEMNQALGITLAAQLRAYILGPFATGRIGPTKPAAPASKVLVKRITFRAGPDGRVLPESFTVDGGDACVLWNDLGDCDVAIEAQMAYLNQDAQTGAGIVSLTGIITNYGLTDFLALVPEIYLVTNGDDNNAQFECGYYIDEYPCPVSVNLTPGNFYDALAYLVVWYDGDTEPCIDDQCYYGSDAEADIYAPGNLLLSPASANIPQTDSATLTIYGDNMQSPFLNPVGIVPCSNECGINLDGPIYYNRIGEDLTSVSVDFDVDADADAGAQPIALNNGFGTASADFTLTAPSPKITSTNVNGVASTTLAIGTQTVRFYGTYFGANPNVIVKTGTGVTIGDITPGVRTGIHAPAKKTAVSAGPRGRSALGHRPSPLDTSAPYVDVAVTLAANTVAENNITFQLTANTNATNPDAISAAFKFVPPPVPPPVILDGSFSDNDNACTVANTIANPPGGGDNTQNVWVGQRIEFTGCLPPAVVALMAADGLEVASSWSLTSFPGGNPGNTPAQQLAAYENAAVAGLNLANPREANATLHTTVPGSGGYVASTATNCANGADSCDFNTAYFLVAGQYILTFTYQLSNGSAGTASVTYNVTGPTPTGVPAAVPAGFLAVPCGPAQAVCVFNKSPAGGVIFSQFLLVPGFLVKQTGIVFEIAANSPAGYPANPSAYQWAQLLAPRTIRTVADAPVAPPACNPCAGLDNTYPYPMQNANLNPHRNGYDSPGVGLSPALAERDDIFYATMYLLWDPSLDVNGNVVPGCAASTIWNVGAPGATSTASQCWNAVTATYYSIPVPLGSISWGYCGDVINTQVVQQNAPAGFVGSTTFKMNCSAAYGAQGAGRGNPVYTPANGASSFPAWGGVVMNNGADQN